VRRAALAGRTLDQTLPACEDKHLAYLVRGPAGRAEAVRLPSRAGHLARETVPQYLRKLFRESRALTRLAALPGFPDCFGWRRRSRRALLGWLTGMLAAAGMPLLPTAGPRALAAAVAVTAVIVAGWHSTGWRGRRLSVSLPEAAALHWAAMTAVTAGHLSGTFDRITQRR
jgi:hypothetical protein